MIFEPIVRLKSLTYLLNSPSCSTSIKNGTHQDHNTKDEFKETDGLEDEEIKFKILKAALPHVYDHGWSNTSILKGCEAAGLSVAAQGMFPRGGIELVEYFYDTCNKDLAKYLEKKESSNGETLPKYEILQDAIEQRLRMIIPYHDCWPQAMGLMALPQNVKHSLCNLQNLADEISYHTGNRKTDISWYSERLSIASVYKATEFYFIQDDSEDFEETWQFLERRISGLETCENCVDKVKNNVQNFGELLKASTIVGQNILSINRNRNS